MNHPSSNSRRSRVSRRSFLAGSGALAAGLSLMPRGVHAEEEKKVNLYNWDTYMGKTTLVDFLQSTGVKATMDLYADNDELFAKLKSGNPGYDIIFPSNDYVARMITAGMLMPLDHVKIPNFKNVDKNFRDAAFDPGRGFSMPYTWGTLGIAYRKSKAATPPDSWKVLFDSDEYSGRIALMDYPRAVLGVALMYLGYSFNASDPKEIAAAEALLTKQKPHIKVFADDNGQDLLLSGEVDVALEWNGDVLQVMAEDDDIGYVVPKEGSELWQDCIAIPAGAPHPENAHRFIDFVLDAEVGAHIAETIRYATPNAAAKALMAADYAQNPTVFPPDDVIARCEPPLYRGEEVTRLLDEAWTRILAAKA